MVSHPAATCKSEKGKALKGDSGKEKFGMTRVNALGGGKVRETPFKTKTVSRKSENIRKMVGVWFGGEGFDWGEGFDCFLVVWSGVVWCGVKAVVECARA